jgi:hypothetical protein
MRKRLGPSAARPHDFRLAPNQRRLRAGPADFVTLWIRERELAVHFRIRRLWPSHERVAARVAVGRLRAPFLREDVQAMSSARALKRLRATFGVVGIAGVALLASATRGASAFDSGASRPASGVPASEWDCANACNDCVGTCGSRPAGPPRSDCQRACASRTAGCCAGYGKRPPGADCYCQ